MVDVASIEIPDKIYFKIGEVAELVGVHTHVLRYWEKEVPAIRPTKSASKQRRYRRRDVETFLEISRLLYSEGYTLAGARKHLSQSKGSALNHELAEEPLVDKADELASTSTQHLSDGKIDKLRLDLRDLIRLAGEQP
jgi:DNA-binding transcriptional MerR regulator